MSGMIINWYLGIEEEKPGTIKFAGLIYGDPNVEDGTGIIIKDLDNIDWMLREARYKGQVYTLGHPDKQWKKYMKQRLKVNPEIKQTMNYNFLKYFE